MRHSGRQVNAVAGLEFDFFGRSIRELDLQDATQDPQTLVFLVPVAWVDCACDIVPTKAFVALLVQASFGFDFRSRQFALFANDLDSFREIHSLGQWRGAVG